MVSEEGRRQGMEKSEGIRRGGREAGVRRPPSLAPAGAATSGGR